MMHDYNTRLGSLTSYFDSFWNTTDAVRRNTKTYEIFKQHNHLTRHTLLLVSVLILYVADNEFSSGLPSVDGDYQCLSGRCREKLLCKFLVNFKRNSVSWSEIEKKRFKTWTPLPRNFRSVRKILTIMRTLFLNTFTGKSVLKSFEIAQKWPDIPLKVAKGSVQDRNEEGNPRRRFVRLQPKSQKRQSCEKIPNALGERIVAR